MIKLLNMIVAVFWYGYQILFNAYLWPKKLKEIRNTPAYRARQRLCAKVWRYTGIGWLALFLVVPVPAFMGYVGIMLVGVNTCLCFAILDQALHPDE